MKIQEEERDAKETQIQIQNILVYIASAGFDGIVCYRCATNDKIEFS